MENLISISNHPIFTNVQRKVRIVALLPNFIENSVRCSFLLEHYRDGILDNQYLKTEFASMFTNNQKYVNLQGQRVEAIQETYINEETGLEATRLVQPPDTFGEYDYLFAYVPQQNKSLGETILEVITFMVNRNDQVGNFNDMSNFRE